MTRYISIRTLLFLLVSLSATVAGAQTSRARPAPKRADPYVAYSKTLETTADSAYTVYRLATSAVLGPDISQMQKVGLVYLLFGRLGKSLAGDFDATTPPEEFVRLHTQISEAALALSDALATTGAVMSSICKQPAQGCDPEVNMAAYRAGLSSFDTLERSARNYVAVHDRAARMLLPHGVTLKELRR